MTTEDLRYPVGQFTAPATYTNQMISGWIEEIATFPTTLEELTADLQTEALKWRYRPGGWTISQVIHHCADSHLNSLMRFKLTLTEDKPTIRPYFEDRWAELPDANLDDIGPSLSILSGLHTRWAYLLRSLTEEQLERCFVHPEHNREFTLKETIGMYSWHCRHHLAHVRQAIATGEK